MPTLLLFAIWFLLAGASLTALDICLYVEGGYTSTISYWLLTLAREWPIVSALFGLLAGILLGHLFWPQSGP
jgi:hypothetical protein